MGLWTPGPGATPGDDVFVGDDFDDFVEGLGGNDVLTGNGGADWLDGGAGDDVLHGGVSDLALHGGDGFDTLSLTFTADQSGLVFMNNGGVVAGGSLFGGMVIRDANVGGFVEPTELTGIETVILFAAGDLEFGGTNVNDVATALGFADLEGLAGDDILTAGDQGGFLDGGDGDDHLTGGAGDENLNGGAGADFIQGGAGSDTVVYGRIDDTPASGITINLALGTASGGDAAGDVLLDVENVFATDFDDTLIGDAEDNTLIANAGDDVLEGGDGDDALNGNDGVDHLDGGNGDDVMNGGAGADLLDGGDGFDIVGFSGFGSVGVHVDLTTQTVSGGDAEGDLISNFEGVIGSFGSDTLTGTDAANTLVGDGGHDTLNGGGGDDALDGGFGNDVMNAGDGDDFLHGGDGNDALNGGDGVDTISYESVFFGLVLSLETGSMFWTEVFLSEVDTFSSIENVRGTLAADTLTGEGGANLLQGIDGNDRLEGRGGDDRLEGGAGNDTLLGEAGEDDLFGGDGNDNMNGGAGADVFDGGLGTDFVSYVGVGVTINLALGIFTGGDAEGDTFVNVEGFNGTAVADSFTGDGGANLFSGGGGADTLAGAGGNDSLTGGAGADALDGGDGVDTAVFSTAVVVSLLAPGANTGEASGDTFISIENLTGSQSADTLTGDGGANSLVGLGGADTLNGEDGDDRLRGGSSNDTLNGGAGNDTVDHSGDFNGVTVNLFAGTAFDGFGATDTLISIENASGSPFDDVLIGDAGENALNGVAGNDTLDGQAGADVLAGGAGDDTINGGEGADTMNGGEGVDALNAGAGDDSAIGGAGDDIVFGGDGDDNLFGESTSETELGVTGNDQLFGGGGDDFMRGGLGDDYLDGGAGSDRASYFAIPGAVRVDLRIQGVAQNTLAGGFDTLVGVENMAGSEFADVLIGNHLANWIWSHGGGDDITGNAGDDTFWIPQGDGVVVRGGQGVDVISFRGRVDEAGTDIGGVTFTLATTLAQDTGRGFVTATSMEGAEGSEFNDAISGNNQDNLLSGFAGDDTVNGAGGDDVIYGDHAVREVGENQSAYNYDDPTYVGDDVLNGGGGEDLIFGNAGDDVIDGGSNADTIIGGLGADRIIGAGGDDQFVYTSAAESSSTGFDTIVDGVWNNGDVFEVSTAVTSFATFSGGHLDAATFDADLGAVMSSLLTAGRAVLFTASSGSFAGQRFLVVDTDGVAGYAAGSDLVFLMQGSAASFNHMGVDDFI